MQNNEVTQKMKSSLQSGFRHDKRMPEDKPDQFVSKRSDARLENASKNKTNQNYDRSHSRDRNTFIMAGQSQFTEERLARKPVKQGSPLKSPMRWEYENEDKNLSDSGEFEVPNNRPPKKNPLVVPFETDREET